MNRAIRANSAWGKNKGVQGNAAQPVADPHRDAASLYQYVCQLLDGPQGINAPGLMAGLGALAGRTARLSVKQGALQKLCDDDFNRPASRNRHNVTISDHVTRLVASLENESFAAVLSRGAMARGYGWMADIPGDLLHFLGSIENLEYPSYSVAAPFLPQVHPDTVLALAAPIINANYKSASHQMSVCALAVLMAIDSYSGRLDPAVAAQLAMESAIAYSRRD